MFIVTAQWKVLAACHTALDSFPVTYSAASLPPLYPHLPFAFFFVLLTLRISYVGGVNVMSSGAETGFSTNHTCKQGPFHWEAKTSSSTCKHRSGTWVQKWCLGHSKCNQHCNVNSMYGPHAGQFGTEGVAGDSLDRDHMARERAR